MALLLLSRTARADEFDELLHRSVGQSHPVTCAQMEDWVARHPTDPRAGRGVVWMARMHLVDGDEGGATTLFRRARDAYPGTEWALHGIEGLADLDVAHHRYGRAIEQYDLLARSPFPFFQYLGQQDGLHTRGLLFRFRITLGLVAVWAVVLAFRVRQAGGLRALWPAPAVLTHSAPLPAALILSALAQPAPEATALVVLGVGSLLLLWLNGAWHMSRRLSLPQRIVETVFGVSQALALLFVAVVLSGIWDKFRDTLVMGAD
jgi:hypothetical protein